MLKWKTFVNKLENNITVLARLSDNVLDEEDWPVHRLTFEGRICTSQIEEHKGVYNLSTSFIGKSINTLMEWTQHDDTGNHPEMYHEIQVVPF